MNNNFAAWFCVDCKKKFFVHVDETADDSHVFYVCPDCKFEFIDLVCPTCKDCNFIDDQSRPLSWTCDKCGTVVQFEPDLYQHPEKLYRFEDLPQEVQLDFEKAKIKDKIRMCLILAFLLLPLSILLVASLVDKLKND